MGDFMAEDGGESVVVLCDGEDAGVDEDFTAGDNEGVAFYACQRSSQADGTKTYQENL